MEAYLDYNATTPLDPRVFEEMKPYFERFWGNASSFHQMGQACRNAMELARERVADTLETEPGDLLFTSGGTESDNLALRGALELFEGRRGHLVVSAIEHQAVLHTARYLEGRGVSVTFVPVGTDGVVDLNRLKESVTERTALVSLMHVNNETGIIQPVEAAAALAHEHGALFHTDAVQSYGKLSVIPADLGADMLSFSGHKICGPKGVGALYVRKGLKLKPILHGGHQEKNIRPGTENVAAIVGFGAAAALLAGDREVETLRATSLLDRIRTLRDRLEAGILSGIQGVSVNGDRTGRVSNTLNVSFETLDGETILMNLDLKNIYVSTGSACTAGSVEPSHVLLAMGLEDAAARSSVRFSIGRFTTEEEIDYALRELPTVIERLRKASTLKGKG